jgi:hypothetical protein
MVFLPKAKPAKAGGAKLQGLRRVTRYASQLPGVKGLLENAARLAVEGGPFQLPGVSGNH